MNILAIETSCDDTCIAIIEASEKKGGHFDILSNIVSSQVDVHKKWGGVYPTLAKREHQKNLPIVLKKALKKAKNPKINLIAVTVGPGLEPCLWTGINFAKKLVKEWNLPIAPVNHIEAHILANFVGENSKFESNPPGSPPAGVQRNSKFFLPAICLVVSGGHTQLILMKNFGKYKILGETRDDAAGECFDKTARILGLGYPGGPAIAAYAAKFEIRKQPSGESACGRPAKFEIKLPRPMMNQKNYDFSFSGLKTAVLYKYKKTPKKLKKDKKYIQAMCAEIQQAVIDVLIKKTIKAARDFGVKTIILGGGVVANEELRKQFKSKVNSLEVKINLVLPPKKFCTDNAVMTAIVGYFRWKQGKTENWKNIEADANLRIG